MDSKIEPVAWRYAINYGPDGEQNYANVYDGNGNMVGNLKTHHAIAIVSAINGSAFGKAPLPEPKAWLFKPTGAIVDPLAKGLLVKRFSEELQRDVSVDFEALVPAAALLAAEQRGREAERGEIVKALSKFVPDYEPWMGKHADGTPLTIHRTGNTFGDLRAAHAAIRKGE